MEGRRNTLTFKAHGGQLDVAGDAYCPSAHPPEDERPGGPSLGSIEARAKAEGREVRIAEGDHA